MQLNKAELMASDFCDKLKAFFNEKVTSSFTFSRLQEQPWIEFSIEFVAYNYFNLVLNYDRGSFGCAIVNGDKGISLPNSQQWYDEADMDIFFKELQEQLELRIPDKFLEYHGWK